MRRTILFLLAAIAVCISVDAKTVKKTFKADGACNMCKERIQKAAKSVPGVLSAAWNKKTKVCTVVFDNKKTNLDKIEKAVASAGHDTDKVKAADKTYAKLPDCCKYRK